MEWKKSLTGIALILSLAACDHIAVMFTPKKQAQASHTALAEKAQTQFWQTLHQGNYQGIAEADKLLTAAYLDNPNDPALAAHLGFLHIWKITERERLKTIPPEIVNEIILSHKYFSDAVELDPSDARYLGFLGDSMIAEGQIFKDQRLQTKAYFTLKRAVHRWPEFNYFTAGYIFSTLPADSEYFKEGLDWQWDTLSLCAEHTVDKQHPDFSPYMSLETTKGVKRACWNSWIAPFNFEGFFLNMGDMLVKSGDSETAVKIYQNARLAKNYSAWPYRPMLEQRIADTKAHVKPKAILFNSGAGCVACHQSQ